MGPCRHRASGADPRCPRKAEIHCELLPEPNSVPVDPWLTTQSIVMWNRYVEEASAFLMQLGGLKKCHQLAGGTCTFSIHTLITGISCPVLICSALGKLRRLQKSDTKMADLLSDHSCHGKLRKCILSSFSSTDLDVT